MKPSQRKLTDSEWEKVFRLRCSTKQGHAISLEDGDLVKRAFREDRARYSAASRDVFNATKPFGA